MVKMAWFLPTFQPFLGDPAIDFPIEKLRPPGAHARSIWMLLEDVTETLGGSGVASAVTQAIDTMGIYIIYIV